MGQKPGVATLDPQYSFVREDKLEIIPILLKYKKKCFKNYPRVNGKNITKDPGLLMPRTVLCPAIHAFKGHRHGGSNLGNWCRDSRL